MVGAGASSTRAPFGLVDSLVPHAVKGCDAQRLLAVKMFGDELVLGRKGLRGEGGRESEGGTGAAGRPGIFPFDEPAVSFAFGPHCEPPRSARSPGSARTMARRSR